MRADTLGFAGTMPLNCGIPFATKKPFAITP